MKFSLRSRLLAAFVLMGLSVLFVSSLVYTLSFEKAALAELEVELLEDAYEFSQTVVLSGGEVAVLDHHEWHGADEEYIVATDSEFRTLRKSSNVGRLEFQQFYDFRPVSKPETVTLEVSKTRLMCVVFPVEREARRVAYILVASSMADVTGYVEILKDSILVSLLILAIFGVGIAYLFAGRMVRPMLSIQQAVAEKDLDSLNKQIELVEGDTELKRLVETLNDLFERLETSYNGINNFSSNVAHELHTPLTILRGNIEVALTRERENREYVEILSDLLEETLNIIHIVDNLLLLARGDTASLSITKTPIDIAQFLDEQARDWEAVCSLKHQDLILDVRGSAGVVGDENLLAQLFLNLVSNASKLSDEGQSVEVIVDKEAHAFNGSSGLKVTVRDKGPGIPEDEQGKVFERFYRVRKDRSRRTGGTGLGLSICEMIAKVHNGDIHLTSEVGRGTSVSVVLPLMARDARSE